MDKRQFDNLVTTIWPRIASWWVQDALIAHREGRFRLILGRGDRDVYLARFWLNAPARVGDEEVFDSGNAVMLHFFPRGDDDQALHDHPWSFRTTILSGGYEEHLPPPHWQLGDALGPAWDQRKVVRLASDTVHRQAADLHCVGTVYPNTWTLVRTGPKERSWGFHPPGEAWQPWREYIAARKQRVAAAKATVTA